MSKPINIQFPLTDDVDSGRFLKTTKVSRDAIRSNLTFLLYTNKGDRWYDPQFGTNLKKFIFEPNDTVTDFDIVEDLKKAVSRYLPIVNIEKVYISPIDDDSPNQALIHLTFTYQDGIFEGRDFIQLKF